MRHEQEAADACGERDEQAVRIEHMARLMELGVGGGRMTDHDLDLYAPLTEKVEPERVCSTRKHLEPCPCGCKWGVCRRPFCRADYMTGSDTCGEWEEE